MSEDSDLLYKVPGKCAIAICSGIVINVLKEREQFLSQKLMPIQSKMNPVCCYGIKSRLSCFLIKIVMQRQKWKSESDQRAVG